MVRRSVDALLRVAYMVGDYCSFSLCRSERSDVYTQTSSGVWWGHLVRAVTPPRSDDPVYPSS